jgi:hypothetical protein
LIDPARVLSAKANSSGEENEAAGTSAVGSVLYLSGVEDQVPLFEEAFQQRTSLEGLRGHQGSLFGPLISDSFLKNPEVIQQRGTLGAGA